MWKSAMNFRCGSSGPVGTRSSISHRPIHSQADSLYHPGGSQMHGPPASASHVLGSQVDTTTLSKVLSCSRTGLMVDDKASTLFSLSPSSPSLLASLSSFVIILSWQLLQESCSLAVSPPPLRRDSLCKWYHLQLRIGPLILWFKTHLLTPG